jgi:UDP-N-acetylmuramoyl-L-alanyl-D-glutamate--2,6-diaminopimelate ligase
LSGQMSLATLLGEWCVAPPQITVNGLCMDSRRLRAGEAFVAVAGTARHGMEFAAEAQDRGACVVIHDGLAPAPALRIPLVEVEGLGARLSRLAARFYHCPSDRLTLAGVTGTNGKTSTAHFIAQAWQRAGTPAGLIGTLGYGPLHQLQPAGLTTPDPITVQRMLAECSDAGVENVAMEVSSHALQQGRCADVAFDVAVFTNLSRDHLDYHGSMERYAAAKRRLFTDCRPGFAVINADDAFGRSLISELAGKLEVLAYGTNGGAELRATVMQMDSSGMLLKFVSPWGEGQVHTGLLGRFNVSNLLAAAGALALTGMPWQQLMHQAEMMSAVPGRMHCLGGENGQPLVVVDFAHTPDALQQALNALRAHLHGRLTCVFGCGGDRDRGKRPLMAAVVESLADRVVMTTDNPRGEPPQRIFDDMLSGMKSPGSALVVSDRASAIRQAIADSQPGDIVLVAGKGHESYQEANGQRVPFSDEGAVRAVLEEAA